jgi:hypothetical protein
MPSALSSPAAIDSSPGPVDAKALKAEDEKSGIDGEVMT